MPRLKRSAADQDQIDTAGPDFLEALARGLRVLETFNQDRKALTLSDIARLVDLPRASVRRTLHTLVHLGYAETDDRLFRLTLQRQRGKEVNTTGDGFVATFDGPARAIRCAKTLVETAKGLGFEIRAGVHTGECELRGDDVGGIAVHVAARVMSEAGASEVLVSGTVKDLVAGSGIMFDDRGFHMLKGLDEKYQLFAVTEVHARG